MKTPTLLLNSPKWVKTSATLFVILLFLKLNVFAQPGTPTITPGGPTSFCDGGSVTLNGSVTPVLGNALSFNGATFGNLSGNSATGLNLQTSSFTIECWAKPTSSDHQLLYYQGQGCLACPGVALSIGNERTCPLGGFVPGKWSFRFDAPGQRKDLIANSNVVLNQWTHIAVTYDGSTLTMYLNGVYENSIAATGLANNNNVFYLGGDPYWCAGTRYMYTGEMDELRIWNVTRTAAEIAQKYNQPCNNTLPGLLAYYNFEETGTALNDISNHGNNGSISSSNMRIGSSAPLEPAWSWSSANNTNSLTVTTSGNYQAGVLNPNGSSALSNTITVQENPNPSVAASSNSPVTVGTTLNLSATGNATGYSWVGPAGFTSAIQNPSITNTLANRAGEYTVTGTLNGCSSTASTTVTTVYAPAGALNLDGTNDNVTIPNSVALNNAISKDFTVSIWTKIPAAQGPAQTLLGIVEKWTGGGDYPFVIRFANQPSSPTTNGKILVARYDADVANPGLYSSMPLNDNVWHHIAFVKDGQSLKLYIDGALDGSANDPITATLTNSSPLYIGKRGTEGTLRGSVDELRIWNRALCQSEVQATMGCELPSGQIGLEAYYPFNQGLILNNNVSDTTLIDMSGNNHHGVLNGFALSGSASNWVAGTASGTCQANITPISSISPQGSVSICQGDSVMLSAGVADSYSWSNGATTQHIFVNTGGNFSVKSTTSGCTAVASPVTTVVLNAKPNATVTTSGSTTICEGSSVTLTAAAGLTYLWSTGETTRSIQVSAVGNYYVTVSNTNCSATSNTITVKKRSLPAPGSITGTASVCNGAPTTPITFNNNPDIVFYNYSCDRSTVSISSVSQTFTAPSSGYITTVAFGSGAWCSTIFASTIISTSSQTVNYGGLPYSSNCYYSQCATGNNMSYTTLPGNGFYVYAGEQVTISFVASGSMHYQDGILRMYITGKQSAPPSQYTYSINGGAPQTVTSPGSSTSVSVMAPTTTNGTFTYTLLSMKDSFGCVNTSQSTATVTVKPKPVVTASSNSPVCAGDSIKLTGNATGSYSWSGPGFTSTLQNPTRIATAAAAGSYTLTSELNGCSATSSPVVVTVNTKPAPIITTGGPTTFCDGGSVTLSASNVPTSGSYTLNWSHGTSGANTIITYPGNYSVTAISPQGCSGTSAPVTVTVNPNPTPTITTGGPTTFCDGGNVYLAAASVPLDGSYQLNWSHGTFGSGTIITYAGNYSVTAISPQGCSGTSAPVTVTVNPNPTPTITTGGPTTFCDGGNVYLAAANVPLDGSYELNWSHGTFGSGTIITYAGNYSVTAISPQGCSGTSAPVNVTVNPNPVASASASPVTCSGGNDGSIIVNAGNGTSPYEYSVNNAASYQPGSLFQNLTEGTYNVAVKDIHGCQSATVSATITQLDTIKPVVITQNIIIGLNSNGQATITSTQINDGSSDNCGIESYNLNQTTFNCTNIGNNIVTLTVTDVNGNSSSATATVTVQDQVAPIPAAKNISVTLSSGMASVMASQLDNGSSDNCSIATITVSPDMFTCSNIGPNTVTFTVTDVNGNTASTTAVVTVVGAIPSASISQSTQPVFSQGGAVVLTASSPTATNYSWAGGPSTPEYYVYASGTYTVTATNQFGCTINASSTVNYTASNLLSAYTIIGNDKVELKDHVTVYNGGVGVTSSCGEAEIENYSTVNASGTFVRAKNIDVKYNSIVSTKIFTAAPSSIIPAFLSNPYCNGNSHSCKHTHHNSCGGNNNNGCGNNNNCSHSHHNNCSNNNPNNKNVNQNTTVVIADSILGTVVIGKNATVTFTSASLYIKDLEIKEGATIHFTKCAVVRVCNHVKMDKNVSFNATTPAIVTMYIEKKLDVDYGVELISHVYAKDKISIEGKSSAPTTVKGLIIGESVKAEKYVSFYSNTTTVCPAGFSKTEILAQEDGLLDEYFDVEVYPNPASSFFNIRLLSSSTESFNIEVYDMNGRLIETQSSNQLSLYNEMGEAYSDGVYFIKITQGEHTKTLRLIKANR